MKRGLGKLVPLLDSNNGSSGVAVADTLEKATKLQGKEAAVAYTIPAKYAGYSAGRPEQVGLKIAFMYTELK